ncbi:MAG: hypothetical protein SGI77_08535 [Pirellulaceae bacterium]|nr:hypothetical protein [Pirellulaceae bacterium]
MPVTYRELDLECLYPDNWKLTEDNGDEGLIGFTIESPDAAFFSLARYPWNCAPREVLERAVPAMNEDYDQFESNPFEPQLDIPDSRGAEVNFYCLDLLVTSQLIAFTLRPYTYLVQMQAEDRTYQKLKPVFQAMLVSILRSLGHDLKID